jgi:hypothetical protein
MTRHRFINDGRSPIPMGSAAEYACVCGKRGTRAIINRHIAENSTGNENAREAAPTAPYEQLVDSNDFGGDTMAHYLPHEPRRPAPTGESPPLQRPGTPDPLPPPPSTSDECLFCGIGKTICDLPEITAWSCGHWIHKRPRSIAELFQNMLRSAFQAGTAATMTGDSFETWYQREVLQ